MNLKTLLMALGISAAAITFAIAGGAHAQSLEWIPFPSDGSEAIRLYIQPALPGADGNPRAWMKAVRTRRVPGQDTVLIALYEVDCSTGRTLNLQTTGYRDYAMQDNTGTDTEMVGWQYATPGTYSDGMVQLACRAGR